MFTLDDEDPLAAVSLLVRVFQNVQEVPLLDQEHTFFKPDGPLGLQLFVLRLFPSEVLHQSLL